MLHQFRKHYTRGEARALLPKLRKWLKRLVQLSQALEEMGTEVERLLAPGCDVGGLAVNRWVRTLADLKELLMEFKQREIQIKDLERGLVDFPAIIDGREVFLCWKQDEPDIEFWHDLDAGFAGRQRIDS